jgi:hypothetical protein
VDSTFAAGLLGNILAGMGISVGAAGGNKKKKKEGEAINGSGGQQTIVIKQPIELITKQPTATRISDLDKL